MSAKNRSFVFYGRCRMVYLDTGRRPDQCDVEFTDPALNST